MGGKSIRDRLLDELERAASGALSPPRARDEELRVQALAAEGLIELRDGRYRATAAGHRALEARGRALGPHGAVTVLFTDVVGSTQLVERLGDRAAHAVLGRHFELLRRAVAKHRGHEVKSLGDGLMVVFAAAPDAVACAAAMQQAIAREGGGLGLRIGIHAGEPVREGNDYFGTPVIVARRLCDAAGAGETLVSRRTQELVAGRRFALPAGLRLKGLSEPVEASALAVMA